jgi:DNA uptake protein ComE-like DNA-binding protein
VIKQSFPHIPLVVSSLILCLVIVGCENKSTTTELAKPEAGKTSPSTLPASAEPKVEKSSKININSATNAELDKLELPGTKPSLSERIENGRPYKQIDDLVTKKAISAEEFKLIQNLVTTETKK